MNSHIDHESTSKVSLGFWLYLMSDVLLFAALFATYAVLRQNDLGGFGAGDFDLNFVLIETFVLLASSFACGLMLLASRGDSRKVVLSWLGVTLSLGAVFLGMELYEFSHLIADGHSWRASAFLSAYFTLVGTHGLHIAFGLLWGAVLAIKVFKQGLNQTKRKQLLLFSLFWHFLDVIWIFIFSFVYLLGAV